MKLRSSLMLGGATCLLLTAMPVVAQETTEEARAPRAVAVTNDVVSPGKSGDPDPFAPDSGLGAFYGSKDIRAERAKQSRKTMRLRIETWEVPSIELVKALDEGTSSDLLATWRKKLMESGTLIFAPVLALDKGYDALGESITEEIYPTEYEGGGLNTPVAPTKPASPVQQLVDMAGKFTIPTAFETRNTGTTMEATLLTVTAEENAWDVLYNLENVSLDGFAEFGLPELQVKMPTFKTLRISGLIRLEEGAWQLATSQPAPLGTKKEPEGKSWVTLVRIDRAR